MDSLLDKKSKRTKFSRDSHDPKELGKVYDRVYEEDIRRIEGQLPQRKERAKKVLSWVIRSRAVAGLGPVRSLFLVRFLVPSSAEEQ
jgi:hypothetical protein